ncbi:MAG: M48 family metallopeptidase [Rikenellaceae bacterium]|nr:M48 family metallopeptidase [Rikenellaceae bacterium]
MAAGKIVNPFGMTSGSKPVPEKRAAPSGKAATSRELEHPALGIVRLSVSRRARRISLTVKPDCTVRLTVPYGTPVERGLDFLELKKGWAAKALDRYRSRTAAILPPYNTRFHELVAVADTECDGASVRIGGGKITVIYHAGLDTEDVPVQEAIKKGICEAWREEAKIYLPPRLETLAARTGLKYGKVAVRNTVSKWGSCSPRNDISLSLHLMRLPDHLIDYILLHELCHTLHKNHGPKFHRLLDDLTGGRHAALRRELRNYHTGW